MDKKIVYTINDICAILPHRPPFLFVDCVTHIVADKKITCERLLRPEEPFFAGHFPQKAIMPGVLITDALAQTSGLLWGFSKQLRGDTLSKEPEIFFLALSNMKFVNPSFPGDLLSLFSTFETSFGTLFSYTVEATVGRKVIAKGTLTLAMVEGSL